jgi:hypothetical protein
MIKRLPSEWCALTGIEVIDADGWNHGNLTKDWNTPINIWKFMDCIAVSTVRNHSEPPKY